MLMKVCTVTKKTIIACALLTVIIATQSFTQLPKQADKDSGLKVLPKNISEEELMALMKVYSKSLGVKCSYCHVPLKEDPSKLDFGSDENPHKEVARKMIVMTKSINKKYLGKMGSDVESITCVSCHMGKTKPVVSVESLVKE